ncbi:MAG TPA: hypothetical protein VHA78_00025 [Candidatus Peribacteraceae bacterium]|nr:hypothetical protein [Candidatus Peribacteraceae bacterium]
MTLDSPSYEQDDSSDSDGRTESSPRQTAAQAVQKLEEDFAHQAYVSHGNGFYGVTNIEYARYLCEQAGDDEELMRRLDALEQPIARSIAEQALHHLRLYATDLDAMGVMVGGIRNMNLDLSVPDGSRVAPVRGDAKRMFRNLEEAFAYAERHHADVSDLREEARNYTFDAWRRHAKDALRDFEQGTVNDADMRRFLAEAKEEGVNVQELENEMWFS